MSLFIGRVPAQSNTEDLEAIFKKYGKMTRCEIKNGQSVSVIDVGILSLKQFNYGFVEFEDKRDAEDALKAHDDREVVFKVIVV
jgi:splicing factor, arginine/serine-rich 7